MEEFAVADQEVKKQNRRARWILTGMFTVLLGLLVFVIFKDDPPPDDAWMLPKFTPGGGERNALAVFCEEIEKHPVVGYDELPREAAERFPNHRWRANRYGKDWPEFVRSNAPALREFLEKNMEVSRALDTLLATQSESWRWPGGDANADYTRLTPSHFSCEDTGQRGLLNVEILVQEGDAEEAISEALKLVRFGHGLQHAEGMPTDWLIAVRIQWFGETALKLALNSPRVGSQELKQAQDLLIPFEPRVASLHFSRQAEYLAFKRYIASTSFGTPITLGASCRMRMRGTEEFFSSYFLRKNRTCASYLHFLRLAPEAWSQDWCAVNTDCSRATREMDAWFANSYEAYLSGNIGGNWVLDGVSPAVSIESSNGCRLVAKHRQIIIMLALRRYELAEEKLPEKLDALVPKYLPAVPLDPFDNAPMRWDAVRQVLYSVGENLVDDGGAIGNPPRSGDKDSGDVYWWKR